MEQENIEDVWEDRLIKDASPYKSFGLRLSAEDVRVLYFLDRARVATRSQIAQHLGCNTAKADRIIARLNFCDLTFGRTMSGIGLRGEAVSISVEGSRLLGLGGNSTNAFEISLLHALPLTDLLLFYENHDLTVITDLEIRREYRIAKTLQGLKKGQRIDSLARFAIPSGRTSRVHFPDLILIAPIGAIAIEYERTRKAANRSLGLISAYAASGAIVGTIFFVPDRPTHDTLANVLVDLVNAKGCTNKIIIKRFPAQSLQSAPLV
jgi:hypothetical protein